MSVFRRPSWVPFTRRPSWIGTAPPTSTEGAGTSSGVGTATALGVAIFVAVGAASGVGDATANSITTSGSAAGVADATAVGRSTTTATGTASGSASATAVAGRFPLTVHASGRYFIDASALPFPLKGDSPWKLLTLSASARNIYLDDRANKGFNVIEVEAINKDDVGATTSPQAGNGQIPFTNTIGGSAWSGALTYASGSQCPDFTTPNEAYWTFIDDMIDAAAQRGICVMFFPSYVGFGPPRTLGTQGEGWMVEMVQNGTTRMQTYGAWIANRYANRPNVIWMFGGDAGTGSGAFNAGETAVEQAFITGIKSVATVAQQYGALWQGVSTGDDQTDFTDELTCWGAYNNDGNPSATCRSAYSSAVATRPAFHIEGPYDEEGPDGFGNNGAATQPIRRFSYWGWLSSIGGYLYGNGYIWRFSTGYASHLSTQGAQDCARLNTFIDSIPWWKLVPSGLAGSSTIVTAGGSTSTATDYVAAARASDGKLILAYVPPAHTGSFSVDMSLMAGRCRARWFDPTAGTYTAIADYNNSGTQAFTVPGANNQGTYDDWLLVISVEDTGAGSTAGTSTATATGLAISAGVGTAAGTSTVAALATAAGVGSSAGVGDAAAVGRATTTAAGAASGAGTATATSVSVASSAGTSTATAVGLANFIGVGTATGTCTATAAAQYIAVSVGTAAGTSTVASLGPSVAEIPVVDVIPGSGVSWQAIAAVHNYAGTVETRIAAHDTAVAPHACTAEVITRG